MLTASQMLAAFDGSWMTRGHQSHTVIGCFTEMETGFVFDCEVLSNFCMQCSYIEAKKKEKTITIQQYNEKAEIHKTNCMRNVLGILVAMEAEAAVRIWGRSVPKNKVSYGTKRRRRLLGVPSYYLSQAVRGIKVKKDECNNHVSKRVGTHLRRLKEQTKVSTGR